MKLTKLLPALALILAVPPALADELTLGTTSTLVTGSACPSSSLATDRCLKANVTCPNVDVREVNLKISNATGTSLGAIILLSGGGGTGSYESSFTSVITNELTDLNASYRLVQVFWTQISGDNGPFASSATPTAHDNPLELMCRPATIFKTIHDDTSIIPAATALCASGQSGGNSQISYAMAHYGAWRWFDAVVVSGGPPHGRLDFGCMGTRNGPWVIVAAAYGGGALAGFTGGSETFIDSSRGTKTECAQGSDGGSLTFWNKWSVLSISATLWYPQTYMRFHNGANDSSEAWPLGKQYSDQVVATNPGRADIPARVTGCSHIVPSCTLGATTLRDSLLALCTYRH